MAAQVWARTLTKKAMDHSSPFPGPLRPTSHMGPHAGGTRRSALEPSPGLPKDLGLSGCQVAAPWDWRSLRTNATVGPLQGLLVNTCLSTRAWDHPIPDPHSPSWRKGYPSALRQPLAPQQEGWSSQWCPWARALHRGPVAGQRLQARHLLWEGSQGGVSWHGALSGLQFHGSLNQVKPHTWTVWAQVVATPSGPPHGGGVGGAMDQEVAHPSAPPLCRPSQEACFCSYGACPRSVVQEDARH